MIASADTTLTDTNAVPSQLGNGWEKRVNSTVNMMLKKKQVAHAAGHMGSYRLSKSMAAREEKRLKRGMKVRAEPQNPALRYPRNFWRGLFQNWAMLSAASVPARLELL